MNDTAMPADAPREPTDANDAVTRQRLREWLPRLGTLGNAVVPQIPEIIGRAIMSDDLAMRCRVRTEAT